MSKPTRITELTPAQRDRMGSWAQEWIDKGWRTTPLTEEEWKVVESGARRCYELAGIPFPKTVVRVSSPIVGAFAAPTAAYLIALHKKQSVDGAVDGAVRGAVGGAVDGAVRGAVGGAVDDAVDDAVNGAVRGAVNGAVDDAVRGAVRGAVDDAVNDAVDDAVRGVFKALDSLRWSGWTLRHWSAWRGAYWSFFRDVCDLHLDGDVWDRSRAWDDLALAGWWWPFRDFVMICDLPTDMHLEQVAPTGWGSHRLHAEDGPAIAYGDGWGLHYWHGVKVPAWVIENPTVEQALQERNSEIRRCAFEAIGWDKVVDGLGLAPISTAADPANAPHELALYSLPRDVYDEPVNLLLMTNGSPDRSGTVRKYGETVPASIADALAAAAWQYGIEPDLYAQLERRT